MSSKTIFCDLCIITLFGLLAVFAEEKSSVQESTDSGLKGNCSCGGFPTNTPAVTDAPLLSQMPGLVVQCDEAGQNTCKNLCNAIATATKAKGPEILCNKLKDAHELKLSAFAKICENPWAYANITAEAPLCCADSKVLVCPSVEVSNGTTTEDVDVKTAI
ncbi:unnamed protein product [Diatraea saccharalis]|uniref:Uncharacterized protein n=1 Tax=Diatraea saccharalis TaxID=40085 RepID=A0A9N9N4C3_9NEOP|nr:unnamed protein product [Diatraea saccharalis]